MEKVGTCSVNSGGPKFAACHPCGMQDDLWVAGGDAGPHHLEFVGDRGMIDYCDEAGEMKQKKFWECAYKTTGVATPADICAIFKSDKNGPYMCSKAVDSSSFPTTE